MKIDPERLEPKLDLEGKYVDFSLLRLALSVYTVVKNEKELEMSKPTGAGECRGICPKCGKAKSFALNVKTNRFNCFHKDCSLKGGGVIDFVSKLFETNAKTAAHLLACAYQISPYGLVENEESNGNHQDTPVKSEPNQEKREVLVESDNSDSTKEKPAGNSSQSTESNSKNWVSRKEHQQLEKKFERLSNIVFGFMLDHDENCYQEEFDEEINEHLIAH